MLLTIIKCFFSFVVFAGSPEVIAHRGAKCCAPENTLPAFALAMDMKADYLEIDVQQTKDGELIIMHDRSVDRTTNGTGLVKDLSYKEIQSLDAGVKFSSKFKGAIVPKLEDVLLLIKNTSVKAIIELKSDDNNMELFEGKVVELIKQMDLNNQIILKSFDRKSLSRLKKIAPNIPQIYVYVFSVPGLPFLTLEQSPTLFNPLFWKGEYVQPHAYSISEDFVRDAHSLGFKVIAWGVDSGPLYNKMKSFGVDLIETDTPNLKF